MADFMEVVINQNGTFSTALDLVTERLLFTGDGYNTGISLGSYNENTHLSQTSDTVDGCVTTHCCNLAYVSPTQAAHNKTGTPVTEVLTALRNTECTIRIEYRDTLQPTSFSNALLWFHTAGDDESQSVSMHMFAMELFASKAPETDIYDTSPTESAWDAVSPAIGITPTKKLIIEAQGINAVSPWEHYIYLGLSITPLRRQFGTGELTLEMDVTT